MPRKETPNAPQEIADEIMKKYKGEIRRRTFAAECSKPYKTTKNMLARGRNKGA